MAWVLVREAAEQVGISEPKLRAAYRSGHIQARDDIVRGRRCKLVDLHEVRTTFAPHTIVDEPDAAVGPNIDEHLAALNDEIAKAHERARRAEQQVSFLRNELAQLQGSHDRVREIVERLSLESFRDSARAAATAVGAPAQRRRFALFSRSSG